MKRNDDFFTPEYVDEQIESLSQQNSHLLDQQDGRQSQPGHACQGKRLLHDLHRFYLSNMQEDARSLKRAWESISSASEHTLPDLDRHTQPVDMLRFQQERLRPMNSNPSVSSRKNSFLHRLGMIAAILFLTLLVGSMLVVFNNAHQSKTHLGSHATTTAPKLQNTQLNIYVSDSKTVYKLDSKSGKVLWSFPPVGLALTPPTVVNGMVYFVAENSYLYALNASNGSVRWKYKSTDPGAYSPTVADGLVFITTSDGRLLALDATTGKQRWQYQAGVEANSQVTVVNGVLYGIAIVDPQSLSTVFYALEAKNGSQLWRKPVSAYFFMRLQVVNGVIYAVSAIDDKASNPPNRYSYVFAFNAQNGSQLWRSAIIHEYVPAPPTVANVVLYLASDELGLEGPHVYAMNTKDGTLIWKKAVAGPVNSSPQVVDGVIYIGQSSDHAPGNNNIIALNAADGSTRWTHPLPEYQDVGNPLVVNNGSIYVDTLDGIIHVLRTSDGSQLRAYTSGSKHSFPFPPTLTLAP